VLTKRTSQSPFPTRPWIIEFGAARMANYDFHQLSSHDFEEMSRDLLQAEWGAKNSRVVRILF